VLRQEASTKALAEEDTHMGQRGIFIVASVALMVLSGCTTHGSTTAVARLTESDVRPPALPTDLVGTWSGSFNPLHNYVATRAGTMALEIRDDGTYTLTTQRGASTQTESGVVVANGRTVTLKSASGPWTSLMRRGGTLYGLRPDAADVKIQMAVTKDSGALASPPSGNTQ
jgi:hypothetical protein